MTMNPQSNHAGKGQGTRDEGLEKKHKEFIFFIGFSSIPLFSSLEH
jgi:hypothetical protein